jgi:hypothetical protein
VKVQCHLTTVSFIFSRVVPDTSANIVGNVLQIALRCFVKGSFPRRAINCLSAEWRSALGMNGQNRRRKIPLGVGGAAPDCGVLLNRLPVQPSDGETQLGDDREPVTAARHCSGSQTDCHFTAIHRPTITTIVIINRWNFERKEITRVRGR